MVAFQCSIPCCCCQWLCWAWAGAVLPELCCCRVLFCAMPDPPCRELGKALHEPPPCAVLTVPMALGRLQHLGEGHEGLGGTRRRFARQVGLALAQ